VGEADQSEYVKELHKRKTALFQSAVESGAVPARPGGELGKVLYVLYCSY
jgi:hypothetical protein